MASTIVLVRVVVALALIAGSALLIAWGLRRDPGDAAMEAVSRRHREAMDRQRAEQRVLDGYRAAGDAGVHPEQPTR